MTSCNNASFSVINRQQLRLVIIFTFSVNIIDSDVF